MEHEKSRERWVHVATTTVKALVVVAVSLALVGCGSDRDSDEAASPTTNVMTSDRGEDFLTAAFAACDQANMAAYTDADRLGYWNHQLTPDEQAEYYEGRAGQVEDLIVALSALEPSPDFTDGWATAMGSLEEYGQWASTNVTTINASSSTVNEGSPTSLQSFLAIFEIGYGNACQGLFDMN